MFFISVKKRFYFNNLTHFIYLLWCISRRYILHQYHWFTASQISSYCASLKEVGVLLWWQHWKLFYSDIYILQVKAKRTFQRFIYWRWRVPDDILMNIRIILFPFPVMVFKFRETGSWCRAHTSGQRIMNYWQTTRHDRTYPQSDICSVFRAGIVCLAWTHTRIILELRVPNEMYFHDAIWLHALDNTRLLNRG